jgi:YD repeat-containing protein
MAANATYAPAFADTGITYDGNGNVQTVTENGVTTTYTYNPDGTVDTDTRLGTTRQYTYDGAGNLTTTWSW